MSIETFIFDEFVLDKNTRELSASGNPVAIEPQVFSLLVYLIENKERVISKDELVENIWQGRFVSESAISSRIKSARKAINDDGKAQRLIRTVHGVGFRFVGELQERPVENLPEGLQEEPEVSKGSTQGAALEGGSLQRRAEDKTPSVPQKKPGIVGTKLIVPLVLVLTLVLVFIYIARQPDAVAGSHTRVAILPINNGTQNAEQDWASLGLMSYVSHYLNKGASVKTVSPHAILALTDESWAPDLKPLEVSPGLLTQLTASQGASHVVVSRLEKRDQLLNLRYAIYSPRGRSPVQTLIGETPIELAKALGRSIISTLPKSGSLSNDLRITSGDPFVAEAYSRGRALQLQGDAEEARNMFKVASEQDKSDIWLRYEYALSTRLMGLADEALNLFLPLEQEALSLEDKGALIAIQNALGILHWRKGDRESAAHYYESSLQEAEQGDDHKVIGTILINLGILARTKGDNDLSRQYLNRALVEFDNAGFTQPPGTLLNSLANLELNVGEVDKAEKYLLQALESYRLVDNKRHEAAVLNNLGLLQQQLGNWQRSEAFLSQGLEIRTSLNNIMGQVQSLNGLTLLNLDQGRFDAALDFAISAVERATELKNQPLLARSLSLKGRALMALKKLTEGRAAFTQALDIHQSLDRVNSLITESIYLGRIALMENNYQQAYAATEVVLGKPDDYPDGLQLLANRLAAAIHLAKNEREAAKTRLEYAFDLAEKLQENTQAVRVAAMLGMLHMEQNKVKLAASYLGTARQIQPEMYETLKLGAHYEGHLGNFRQALELMREARSQSHLRWTAEDQQALERFQSQSTSE